MWKINGKLTADEAEVMKELKTITQSKLYAWEQNRNIKNLHIFETLDPSWCL